jgi:hypothetical protein
MPESIKPINGTGITQTNYKGWAKLDHRSGPNQVDETMGETLNDHT